MGNFDEVRSEKLKEMAECEQKTSSQASGTGVFVGVLRQLRREEREREKTLKRVERRHEPMRVQDTHVEGHKTKKKTEETEERKETTHLSNLV
jgi:hypothetical protein